MKSSSFLRLVKIAVVALVLLTGLQGAFPLLPVAAGPAQAQAAAAEPLAGQPADAAEGMFLSDVSPVLQIFVILLCALFVALAVFPLFIDVGGRL